MSQMHQMQLTYVPKEDRILFRLNTKNRQEYRFWLTRRYVAILWKTISRLVQDSEREETEIEETGPPSLTDPIAESAKIEIEHQEIISQADFQTQYQESSYLPLGEEPALLFSVGVKPNPDGTPLLCLHPEKGEGIELALNDQILHSFCQLVVETVNRAGWALDLRFSGPSSDSEKEGPGLN